MKKKILRVIVVSICAIVLCGTVCLFAVSLYMQVKKSPFSSVGIILMMTYVSVVQYSMWEARKKDLIKLKKLVSQNKTNEISGYDFENYFTVVIRYLEKSLPMVLYFSILMTSLGVGKNIDDINGNEVGIYALILLLGLIITVYVALSSENVVVFRSEKQIRKKIEKWKISGL